MSDIILPVYKSNFFGPEFAEIEHIERYPAERAMRPDMHHIQAFSPADGDYFWLAINIGDRMMAAAMLDSAREHAPSQGMRHEGFGVISPDTETPLPSIYGFGL